MSVSRLLFYYYDKTVIIWGSRQVINERVCLFGDYSHLAQIYSELLGFLGKMSTAEICHS